MAMSRWDPFRELSSIQSDLNRLFGRTYGVEGDVELRAAAWVPPVDVAETQDRFYEQKREDDFHQVERRFGAFARSITLPSSADPEGIQASFDAGVLTIEVPKKEEAKPRKIQVKATG